MKQGQLGHRCCRRHYQIHFLGRKCLYFFCVIRPRWLNELDIQSQLQILMFAYIVGSTTQLISIPYRDIENHCITWPNRIFYFLYATISPALCSCIYKHKSHITPLAQSAQYKIPATLAEGNINTYSKRQITKSFIVPLPFHSKKVDWLSTIRRYVLYIVGAVVQQLLGRFIPNQLHYNRLESIISSHFHLDYIRSSGIEGVWFFNFPLPSAVRVWYFRQPVQ